MNTNTSIKSAIKTTTAAAVILASLAGTASAQSAMNAGPGNNAAPPNPIGPYCPPGHQVEYRNDGFGNYTIICILPRPERPSPASSTIGGIIGGFIGGHFKNHH